jgi:hypothetical protein
MKKRPTTTIRAEAGRPIPVWVTALVRLRTRRRDQKRHLERATLRFGELAENVVQHRLEQIGQAGEGQLRLDLDGTGRQHHERAASRPGKPLQPKRRLPQPRSAFELLRIRTNSATPQEPIDLREFSFSADELPIHHPHPAPLLCQPTLAARPPFRPSDAACADGERRLANAHRNPRPL